MDTQTYIKNAFTLAEVLITLVIIGVIAAMTVPTLMKNTQNQEFVTGVKKAQSILSQALIDMAKNNDSSPGDYSFLTTSSIAANEFAKVTNVIKKCGSISADCFGSNINGGDIYKTLNNQRVNLSPGHSLITGDGQIYSFCILNASSNISGLSEEDTANALVRIVVDVNGQKGPNVVGRDFFFFYIVNGKGVVPCGIGGEDSCNKSSTGQTCTARVLKENAMNY